MLLLKHAKTRCFCQPVLAGAMGLGTGLFFAIHPAVFPVLCSPPFEPCQLFQPPIPIHIIHKSYGFNLTAYDSLLLSSNSIIQRSCPNAPNDSHGEKSCSLALSIAGFIHGISGSWDSVDSAQQGLHAFVDHHGVLVPSGQSQCLESVLEETLPSTGAGRLGGLWTWRI